MIKETLKLALEALEYWDVHGKLHQPTEEAITAIKEALAQPDHIVDTNKMEAQPKQTKLEQMWDALAAYQPQADAHGHGDTWAAMCSEKTATAANAAANTAAAAYAVYAADAADAAAYAVYAEAGAADYGTAVYGTATYAEAAAYAEMWAKKATARINKLKEQT